MDNVPGRRFPVQKVLNALMDDVRLDVTPEKNSWVKTTAIGVPVAPMDLSKMLNARNSIATKQAAVETPIVPQINFVILKTIDAHSKARRDAVEKRIQRQVSGMAVCGCDGTYGVDQCSIQSASADIFEFGGCLIPDLGGAFACGPSVCMSTQHYCRIDVNPHDPDGFPLTSCEPIPDDCSQGDCRCFVAKNPEYACFSGSGLVVLVPRTRND